MIFFNMTPAGVIVADDLTGAADCGIACTVAGLQTVVVAFGDLARAAALAADVISFDTDTRRATPEAAASLTAEAVRVLCGRSGNVRVLYKKIDSTLRGNFAVEIAAARQAATGLLADGNTAAAPLAIVAPAFPATGRTTRGGRMFLDSEPLEESAVWRNEKITGVADVPALLAATGLPARPVVLETVRDAASELTAAFAEAASAGFGAVVCDVESEDDLQLIAQASVQYRGPMIFAGSAGLARHLPSAFGLGSINVESAEHRPALPTIFNQAGPLLFLVGSMSQVSREGARTLAAEPGVQQLTIEPSALRDGPASGTWQQTNELLETTLASGDDLVLSLGLDEGIDLSESARLSKALARLILPLAPRLGGLFVTGGETARALLNAAGAAGIRLRGEVEPGVPLGTAEGWRDLPVITKAGAFGNAQTLVRCRAALRDFLGAG